MLSKYDDVEEVAQKKRVKMVIGSDQNTVPKKQASLGIE